MAIKPSIPIETKNRFEAVSDINEEHVAECLKGKSYDLAEDIMDNPTSMPECR